MSSNSYRESLIGHAVMYVFRYGLSVIPMRDKRPTIKWAFLQERHPKLGEILKWDMDGLAVVTGEISNIVVIDCDTMENAKWWHRQSETPVIAKTKRGAHFYYRHPGERVKNAAHVEVNGVDRYDVRGDGGYVVLPPSRHGEGRYKWVKPMIQTRQLPAFETRWRPANDTDSEKKIKDGARYIEKIHAVGGQGGHNATFRAVASLKDAGFSEGEAVFALQQWNRTNAHPPWGERELLHKIRSVYK